MEHLKQIIIVISMCFAMSVFTMDEQALEKAVREKRSLIESLEQDLDALGTDARKSSMYNAIEAHMEEEMVRLAQTLIEMAAVVTKNIENAQQKSE